MYNNIHVYLLFCFKLLLFIVGCLFASDPIWKLVPWHHDNKIYYFLFHINNRAGSSLIMLMLNFRLFPLLPHHRGNSVGDFLYLSSLSLLTNRKNWTI